MRKKRALFLNLLFGVALIAALVALFLFLYTSNEGFWNNTPIFLQYKIGKEAKAYKTLEFDLVDPGQAPETIKALAEKGFHVMLQTHHYAPDYVGNKLNCTNCHFAAGNTTGGAQNGISLVGVATKYPAYDNSMKKVIDLPARINNCFARSMNGKALPLDSEVMLALVTYMYWISEGLPIYGNISWLGLEPLSKKYSGDAMNGKKLYEVYCSLCHKEDGKGDLRVPPLWGDHSFNQGAGFNRLDMLATFIFWNMPYNDMTPVLSEQEAFDVGTYILAQPRPE